MLFFPMIYYSFIVTFLLCCILYFGDNMSIVSTNVNYNYDVLIREIYSLQERYPFLYLDSIGNSVLGNAIVYIRLGRGTKEVFYNASFHANEWITTPVLMKFIEDFCIAYTNNSTIYGYSAREIFNTTSIYIVPMVNPDGVNLVTGNLPYTSNGYNYARNIASNYPDIPFPSGWKANIEGVDLENLQPVRKAL